MKASYANFNEYLAAEWPNAKIHPDGFLVQEARHVSGLDPIPHAQEKPWGGEIWTIYSRSGEYAEKILFVNPGEQLSIQHHKEKEETWEFLTDGYVLLGEEGNPESDVTERAVSAEERIHVVPFTKHSILAKEKPVILREVSSGQLDDVVRHEDKYNRTTPARQV